MRVLLVALLVGSLLQIAQVPVTAAPAEQSSTPPGSTGQNSAAQMTVRAGFEGYGKANGWLPIEVEVRNDGPDIDGEIQIVVSDASGNRSTYMRAPVVYSAPAVLPKRSHKRILMEAEMRLAGQRIQARLLERGTVLAEQRPGL
jgi:protein-disulfide isomerase